MSRSDSTFDHIESEFMRIDLNLKKAAKDMSAMVMSNAQEMADHIERSLNGMVSSGRLQHMIEREVELAVQEQLKNYFKYGAGRDTVKLVVEVQASKAIQPPEEE